MFAIAPVTTPSSLNSEVSNIEQPEEFRWNESSGFATKRLDVFIWKLR
jgi:hypothetical protein